MQPPAAAISSLVPATSLHLEKHGSWCVCCAAGVATRASTCSLARPPNTAMTHRARLLNDLIPSSVQSPKTFLYPIFPPRIPSTIPWPCSDPTTHHGETQGHLVSQAFACGSSACRFPGWPVLLTLSIAPPATSRMLKRFTALSNLPLEIKASCPARAATSHTRRTLLIPSLESLPCQGACITLSVLSSGTDISSSAIDSTASHNKSDSLGPGTSHSVAANPAAERDTGLAKQAWNPDGAKHDEARYGTGESAAAATTTLPDRTQGTVHSNQAAEKDAGLKRQTLYVLISYSRQLLVPNRRRPSFCNWHLRLVERQR